MKIAFGLWRGQHLWANGSVEENPRHNDPIVKVSDSFTNHEICARAYTLTRKNIEQSQADYAVLRIADTTMAESIRVE